MLQEQESFEVEPASFFSGKNLYFLSSSVFLSIDPSVAVKALISSILQREKVVVNKDNSERMAMNQHNQFHQELRNAGLCKQFDPRDKRYTASYKRLAIKLGTEYDYDKIVLITCDVDEANAFLNLRRDNGIPNVFAVSLDTEGTFHLIQSRLEQNASDSNACVAVLNLKPTSYADHASDCDDAGEEKQEASSSDARFESDSDRSLHEESIRSFRYFGGKSVGLAAAGADIKCKDVNGIKEKNPSKEVFVFDSNGDYIQLLDKIGGGGEGVVYKTDRTERDGIVAKIYIIDRKNKCLSRSKEDRIRYMCAHRPDNQNLIWPIDLLYDDDRNFIGFTMKFVQGGRSLEEIMRSEPEEKKKLSRKDILRMIISILDTMVYLHKRNIIVGDIKLDNFSVVDNDFGNIVFMDCDSFQIDMFPATATTRGFTPPELMKIRVDSIYRTFENEYYSLFVLLFEMLHNKVSPYQQIQKNTEYNQEDLSKMGKFPYSLNSEATKLSAPLTGFAAVNWSHLPSYIKKAFISVGQHDDGNFSNRISSEDWLRLFTAYEKDLDNGRLDSDPYKDEGVFCCREDMGKEIDYSFVDLNLDVIRTGFRLNEVVENILADLYAEESPFVVGEISDFLRERAVYSNGKLKMSMRRNLGFFFEIEASAL